MEISSHRAIPGDVYFFYANFVVVSSGMYATEVTRIQSSGQRISCITRFCAIKMHLIIIIIIKCCFKPNRWAWSLPGT